MATLFALPRATTFDGSARINAGGQLFFYQTGTTTPKDTYSDDGLLTPNANPVVADANGLFPAIYMADGDYKVILKDQNGVTVWTVDPYSGTTAENTLTMRGDLLTRDALGYKRLPVGLSGQFLGTNGVDPVWVAAPEGFKTGDAKMTFRAPADIGWVLMDDGSIGSPSSGATNRASDDTEDLYTLLWNNVSDTGAPVAGGRGADAAADFAADKPMTLPRQLGRAFIGAGTGQSLTNRPLGEFGGAQTQSTTVNVNGTTPVTGGGGAAAAPNTYPSATFSIMQPYAAWNVMIKL